MSSISRLDNFAHVAPVSPLGTGNTKASDGFHSVFNAALHSVESGNKQAEDLTKQFLAGEAVDVHSVAIATQKATLQFEMFMQMRNKVVSAYQEIMRMQL